MRLRNLPIFKTKKEIVYRLARSSVCTYELDDTPPFEINAEKDLTFLQEGILDMLGSRLAWRDRVS